MLEETLNTLCQGSPHHLQSSPYYPKYLSWCFRLLYWYLQSVNSSILTLSTRPEPPKPMASLVPPVTIAEPGSVLMQIHPILQEFRVSRDLFVSDEPKFPLLMGPEQLSVLESGGSVRPYLSLVPPSSPISSRPDRQESLPLLSAPPWDYAEVTSSDSQISMHGSPLTSTETSLLTSSQRERLLRRDNLVPFLIGCPLLYLMIPLSVSAGAPELPTTNNFQELLAIPVGTIMENSLLPHLLLFSNLKRSLLRSKRLKLTRR